MLVMNMKWKFENNSIYTNIKKHEIEHVQELQNTAEVN